MALRGVRPGPLLVVHGLGDGAAGWRRFAAAMPAGRDAVTFDLPGHGESPPADDYRYPALVEAVGRAAAGYDRFALLGHSVGIIPTPTPIWRRRSGRSPPPTRPRPKRSFARAIGSGRTAAGSLLSNAAIFPPLVDDARENGRRYWEELGRIRAPTLVVRAGGGMVRAGQLEEVAAAIPGARLLTLDGMGHFLHREGPDQLARAVSEFLTEPPPAEPG